MAAWSPDGKRIATIRGRRGEVHTSTGRLIFSKWFASVVHRAGLGVADAASRSRRAVGRPEHDPHGLDVRRARGTRVYTHVRGCDDDGGPVAAIQWLQTVPHSTSLVYQSYCAEPFHNLYAIAPDGTGLRRITNVQADQVQPRLSPDGTRIAFAESPYVGSVVQGLPAVASHDRRRRHGRRHADLAARLHVRRLAELVARWDADHVRRLRLRHGPSRDADRRRRWDAHRPPHPDVDARVGTDASRLREREHGSDDRVDRVAGRHGRHEVAAIPNLTEPAWSADGRLAYLAGTTVVVQGRKVTLPFAKVTSLAWSPDGNPLRRRGEAEGRADVRSLHGSHRRHRRPPPDDEPGRLKR